MRVLLTIARVFVGVLFIFSGLVKANDPLGLSYKMQEYFEVWHMYYMYDYSLAFALVMNVFEIVAGIAVLLGWRMKLFGWLLLLLILFFTFLTGFAAFSGKIAACGCFGDCIPLKPIESFWKDIILLVLIVFLLANHRSIRPLVSSGKAVVILLGSTVLVALFQWYVLRYLPVVDCLPYRKGNDLLQQMKTPDGFTPDEYSYVFIYEKDGKQYEFTEENLPEDETYTFVDRKEKLVKKGNDLKAKITDFNMITGSGNDTTQAILGQAGRYVLIFTNEFQAKNPAFDISFWKDLQAKAPVYIVSSVPVESSGIPVFKTDGTVIKTAARSYPTYFVMQGARVLGKFSNASRQKVLELLN